MFEDRVILENLYKDIRFESYFGLNEAFDSEMGATRPIRSDDLINYINRTLKRRENKENKRNT